MRRFRAGFVILLAALLTLGALPAGAQTSDLSDVGERSFADIAACVANSETLLVTVVVDQSGSLQNTDPGNERVGAVDTAVDALSGLRETAGGELDVQMNLAVFDGGYEELVGWGSLAGDHPQTLRNTALQELPARNTGDFTDYRAALRGAESSLAEQSASVDPQACKVILWFTDGRLDVGGETPAAEAELCEPRGIADSLRGGRVAIVALALFTSEGQGAVSSEDANLLRAVAEGSGEGTQCGTVPVPENYTSGAYLRATDAAALRRVFAGAGTMIEGGQQALTITCPGDDCIDGQFRVPLDEGLSGFRLVLDGVRDDQPPVLRSPDGDSVELASGSAAPLGGGDLASSTRDGLTVVDLTFPSGSSPGGSWVLDTQATPQQVSVVDLYYFWGVGLEVRAPAGLTIGETAPLEVVVSYADGTPVDAADFQSLTVRMRADGEDVALAPDGTGLFRGAYDVPAQGAPAALDIAVAAEAVSSPSSVGLGPVTASTRLQTVLPPAYATLLTHELQMPQIVGDGKAGGILQFRGSEEGETRVCVESVEVAGPELAGDIQVSTPGDCLTVPADAAVDWNVDVAPAEPADGRIDGSITLSMSAVDSADTVTVDVPFGASMMRPVNEPLRWGLVALLVLVGLLLPVAIAWVGNYLNGTYRVSPRTVRGSTSVRLSPDGVRGNLGEPLLTIDDFQGLQISRDERRARLSGPVELTRRLPVWPFGEVRFEGMSQAGIVLSSEPPYVRRGGQRAPSRSNFGDVFFIRVSGESLSEDHVYEGHLIVFDTDDPDLSTVVRRREQQLSDFRDWGGLVSALEEEIARRTGRSSEASSEARARPQVDRPLGTPSAGASPPEDRRPSLWDVPEDGGGPMDRAPRPTTGGSSGGEPEERHSEKPRSIFDD